MFSTPMNSDTDISSINLISRNDINIDNVHNLQTKFYRQNLLVNLLNIC